MAQQNLGDLITRVEAWSNRKDISDSLYTDFINIALSRILRTVRLPIMEAVSSITVDSDGSAEIPRDYLEAIDLRVTASGRTRSLERKDIAFVEEVASESTGVPCYFARRGTKFYLAPMPQDVSTVQLYYYITLQPLVQSTDTNWFIADAPELLLYGALTELALYVKDEIAAAQWEAKFRAHAVEVQRLADDAQWSGSALSIHTR